MKTRKRWILLAIPLFLLLAVPTYAASSDFLAKAQKYFDKNCDRRTNGETSMLCYLYEKVREHDQSINQLSGNKSIYAVVERRGGDTNVVTSTDNTALGNQVTISCPANCKLWVNYFVDARNTETSTDPRGYFNYYTVYVDGVNQAVTNQASFPVSNSAVPLSLNGVFSVGSGNHAVEIYGRVNGGQMENHEAGLQVMAIKE